MQSCMKLQKSFPPSVSVLPRFSYLSVTANLIRASIAVGTGRACCGALERLDAWLDGRTLKDEILAGWIADLHDRGFSSSTASLAVAAVRFHARVSGMENPAGPYRKDPGRHPQESNGAGPDRGNNMGEGGPGGGQGHGGRHDTGTARHCPDHGEFQCAPPGGADDGIGVRDIGCDPDSSTVCHIRRSNTDQEGLGPPVILGIVP